jgi:DNA-binding MarR family transcriptional regulator
MTKVFPKASPVTAEVAGAREVISAVADLVSLVEPQLLDVWRSTGMTFTQRRVLRQLRDAPRYPGDVAMALGMSGPSLTRQLAKLQERGFITRTLDKSDRRRILVDLTAEGTRVLAGHRIFAGSTIARAAKGLTAAQRQDLVESLSLLVGRARGLEPGNAGE